MDYNKTANAILQKVGGSQNVQNVTHCITRLRFTLVDTTKADTPAIKAIDGVVSVIEKGGQYQVVIGNEVDNVYKAVMKLVDIKETSKSSVSAQPAEKKKMNFSPYQIKK